jgi:hypothetical protein
MNFRIYVLWFSILFRIIYIYKNISMIGIYKFGKKKSILVRLEDTCKPTFTLGTDEIDVSRIFLKFMVWALN